MEIVHPDAFGQLKQLVTNDLAERGELQRWLDSTPYGSVAHAVRRASSPERDSEAVLRALDRRGLLDQSFFASLTEELPHRSDELRSVASEMGVPMDAVDAYPDVPPGLPDSESTSSDPTPNTQFGQRPDPGMLLSEFEAVRTASASVVQILQATGTVTCAGVLLLPDLVVVPSFVVGGANSIEFARSRRSASEETTARLVAARPLDPLAGAVLFHVDPAIGPGIRVSDAHPQPGEFLTMLHYPYGASMRISRAEVTGSDDSRLFYRSETSSGSAGGALLDAMGRVVGFHMGKAVGPSGEQHGVGLLASSLLAVLRREEAYRAVYLSVTEPLRTVAVDPALESMFHPDDPSFGKQLPVVIETLYSDVNPAVEGLTISSHSGTIVSAAIDAVALEALRVRSDIVSIDLSRNAGTSELFSSYGAIFASTTPRPPIGEKGDKCLIAVIDDGVDVHHNAFAVGGSTKIDLYWDQLDPTNPCSGGSAASAQRAATLGLGYGRLYDRSDIDAIRAGTFVGSVPIGAPFLHGTAVAAIAAGVGLEPAAVDRFPGGVAPASPLIVVHTNREAPAGYERCHVDALSFIDAVATAADLPVVVNISSGVNVGGHDGSSLVEKRCESFSSRRGRVVVKSAGNESRMRRHTRFAGVKSGIVESEFEVADQEGNDLLEYWWLPNEYKITVIAPDGTISGEISRPHFGHLDETLMGTRVLAQLNSRLHRDAALFRARLRLELIAVPGGRVPNGRWKVRFEAVQVFGNDLAIHGWIEISQRSTAFLSSSNENTLTVPGTNPLVVTVAAMSSAAPQQTWSDSSMGPTSTGQEKPDIGAPGISIRSASADSSEHVGAAADGTSFAAPHVTGAIALALSAAHKDDATLVPTAAEVIEALRRHTPPPFDVWSEQAGYGPLNVPDFLAKLAEVLTEAATPDP